MEELQVAEFGVSEIFRKASGKFGRHPRRDGIQDKSELDAVCT